jgi:hypothetical protein
VRRFCGAETTPNPLGDRPKPAGLLLVEDEHDPAGSPLPVRFVRICGGAMGIVALLDPANSSSLGEERRTASFSPGNETVRAAPSGL